MNSVLAAPEVLYRYPEQTRVGSVIPKSKIYQHGKVKSRIREMFIQRVSEISWDYKLAPETLHLPESDGVREIQVFRITLKSKADTPMELLETMDRSIPSPIIFEIEADGQIQAAASYKRMSRADQGTTVIHSYLHTTWMEKEQERLPLPTALSMGELYSKILRSFSRLPGSEQEDLEAHIHRAQAVWRKETEIQRLKHTMEKEIQFNRKVELNHQLKELEQEIWTLLSAE